MEVINQHTGAIQLCFFIIIICVYYIETVQNCKIIIYHSSLLFLNCVKLYKKFELMLTRCVKAFSSSCSQTVSLSSAILSQFILRLCAAAKDYKNQQKPLFWKLRVFQSHRW